jgi:hypothetical protein
MYQSLDVLSAQLTCPTALFAFVVDDQVVAKVPDVKLVPAPNQKFNLKLSPLSL